MRKIMHEHLYINRGRYVPASVCRGESALRAKARGKRLAAGHAAKPRPCDPAAKRCVRGLAASCRGKAEHGKAAYNLVLHNSTIPSIYSQTLLARHRWSIIKLWREARWRVNGETTCS